MKNLFSSYVSVITCSTSPVLIVPKFKTVPSQGDTKQLLSSTCRTPSLNGREKKSAKLG